mmetsp:Transcript_21552/g.31878  ORF Transcript_21552/g.31878 Transcript_21552/m.31878 type:complete len:214 (-) Transcript_21552:515-1156(-)
MVRSTNLPTLLSFAILLFLLDSGTCLSTSHLKKNAPSGKNGCRGGTQTAMSVEDSRDRVTQSDDVSPNMSHNGRSRRCFFGTFAAVAISPLVSNPSEASAAGFSFGSITTNADGSSDPFQPDLSRSDAFLRLPRERALTLVEKEIRSVQELEDDRLRQCEDRGQFWEQCFIYGMRDNEIKGTRGPVDYQMVAPEAALEPVKMGKGSKTKVPTW